MEVTQSQENPPKATGNRDLFRGILTNGEPLGWPYLSCSSVHFGTKRRFATGTYELGISARKLCS